MMRTSADLDATDPLASYRDRFLPMGDVTAYLDGNSLGRPLRSSAARIEAFVREQWAARLIRGWDEGWLDLPLQIGDELGRVALGAEPGQVAIGDSTTVLLYKLIRAALDARPDRREIVIERDNFPTDRYIVEGIATDRGLTIRWVDTAADAVAGPETALVVLSHVAYRSGLIADAAAITAQAHGAGALVLWDLCHSAGAVPVALDDWGADLAVGCSYKYLNGGPGSPAFAYVPHRHQAILRQPIQGWLGSATPFEMGPAYEPAGGIRGFLSGTPPIIGMLAVQDMIALIDLVGLDAVRQKSLALTAFAIELADELLPDAVLATPREPTLRGSHITLDHPGFAAIMPRMWEGGILPDFRRPTGIRLGLSPLSTSFAEVELGVRAIARELAASSV